MAKKVVATLKSSKADSVKYAKVIRAVKSPTTGAYSFREEIVPESEVQKVLSKKD